MVYHWEKEPCKYCGRHEFDADGRCICGYRPPVPIPRGIVVAQEKSDAVSVTVKKK